MQFFLLECHLKLMYGCCNLRFNYGYSVMIIVSRKTKIRHRNGINKTLADMPLSSRRVLFLAIANIDPKIAISKDAVFRIYATDYADICGIESSTAYQQMKEAATQLQQQVLAIPREELLAPICRAGDPLLIKKKHESGVRVMNVTEYCDYVEGEGYIDVVFSRQMEPYICRLEKDFTTQVLLSAVRISDTNASKLYQYLRQKISAGKIKYFDVLLDDFKRDLSIDKYEHYKEFKHLKSQFFNRSAKTIIAKTEFLKIDMEIITKRKRKAYEIRISYEFEDV